MDFVTGHHLVRWSELGSGGKRLVQGVQDPPYLPLAPERVSGKAILLGGQLGMDQEEKWELEWEIQVRASESDQEEWEIRVRALESDQEEWEIRVRALEGRSGWGEVVATLLYPLMSALLKDKLRLHTRTRRIPHPRHLHRQILKNYF